MARNVKDAAFMMNIISGKDENDATTMECPNSVVEPIPNSSMFVFPVIIASEWRIFQSCITVASYGEIKRSSIFDAHVVFLPDMHMLSFMDTGIP